MLGQTTKPPLVTQSKKPIVSKPVRLVPPPSKSKQDVKLEPSTGVPKKSKRLSGPVLKTFLRKTEKLNFIDGDRVLMVGDGLIEQAQKQGYLEYRITVQNSGKKVVFS